MTKHEANRLLDRHKETKELSYSDATRALAATGDYEGYGGEGVDCQVQEETERPWECPSIGMVATSLVRHREKAWVSRR